MVLHDISICCMCWPYHKYTSDPPQVLYVHESDSSTYDMDKVFLHSLQTSLKQTLLTRRAHQHRLAKSPSIDPTSLHSSDLTKNNYKTEHTFIYLFFIFDHAQWTNKRERNNLNIFTIHDFVFHIILETRELTDCNLLPMVKFN